MDLVILENRHQPFQGIVKMRLINKLKKNDNAKGEILCHGNSMSYRVRCHYWHLNIIELGFDRERDTAFHVLMTNASK